jgi:N utilization substance protein A
MEGLTAQMLVALGENDVKTLDDLADLAGGELQDYVGAEAISEDDANTVIMAARVKLGWFEGMDDPTAVAEDDGAADVDGEETA